ncbi:hypothetical protein QR685DRAFT_156467 [Neurospora intermedia]|uniref:Abscisic acid ABA receptor n=1 Tax=Neurospora intermedia TaxID=5142 RepID=A0ABR3DJR8_NEUIN
MAESRYMTLSDPSSLLKISNDTSQYLQSALEDIVASYPPRSRYSHEHLQGLWSGPTGIALLMLQISARQPSLLVSGQTPYHWAKAYISGSRGHNLRLGSRGCGIHDEKLAFEAVRASIFREDPSHVRTFVSCVSQILEVEEYPDEILYGRAGTLYLLRLVRHWVPGSNKLVDPAIAEITNTILNRGPNWTWHDKRYLGAVHGDIGILTQVVLTSPETAPQLESVLDRLLRLQHPSGNWPSSEQHAHTGKCLVQFCHGAPGFVVSLLSLREHFPALQEKVDAAIGLGRKCIWAEGLLKKEPSLCHGIFGNALALPKGPQREHFLAVATPENVANMKRADHTGTIFDRADYGRTYSTTTSYTPSAAWAWLVCDDEHPKMLAYNDI